tara:strand:- start:154 stop:735 length:582 start_codon:yes stop_codon:yes gene_type:complete
MNKITDQKKILRKEQFKIREKIFSNVLNSFNHILFEELFSNINFNNSKIISSFVSINTEISTKKLNDFILKKNKVLCFPVVKKENSHLIFRKFTSNEEMINGFMNIKEPSIKNQIMIPEILFVPCLAFDSYGYRLGYGGGYYDKTFSYLHKIKSKFTSIGYAFDNQKVSDLPKDRFDMKLDYVITEKKIYSYK